MRPATDKTPRGADPAHAAASTRARAARRPGRGPRAAAPARTGARAPRRGAARRGGARSPRPARRSRWAAASGLREAACHTAAAEAAKLRRHAENILADRLLIVQTNHSISAVIEPI